MSDRQQWTEQNILNLNLDQTVSPPRLVIGQAAWDGASWVAVEPDPLVAYKVSDKDDDSSPNYYGFVRADGAWYILKETVSAGNDTYRYVKGTSNYATNWGNRASLSYDYYYTIF